MVLEIYDCTLREGEQASECSFSANDRLELVRKLDEFGVDYIEIGWPSVSKEIFESIKKAQEITKKARIVAFGSTSRKNNPIEDENLNTIITSGAKYACIFGKTSINHVEKQLKLTKEENLLRIKSSVRYLKNNKLTVFYDAEHYFDSFLENKEYALKTLIFAIESGAKKVILCDTNGGLLPNIAEKILKETYDFLKSKSYDFSLGVHFHNDSGLALANTLVCLPYIAQVQGTINGIGERVGNLNFSEFLPVYIKKLNNPLEINLKKLKHVNEFSYRCCGMDIPKNRAFVGDNAFLHKAGVHIDATIKGASYEHADPRDFGNERVILLNSLGGKSSIMHIAEKFNINFKDLHVKEKIKKLLEELKHYEKKGYNLGAIDAEQFLLMNKYFGDNKKYLEILEWSINSDFIKNQEKSRFLVLAKVNNEIIEETMEIEGGPVDCAFKTIKKLLTNKYPIVKYLHILDFHVSIARQKQEESTVRTRIDFYDENFAKFSRKSFLKMNYNADNLVNYSKFSDEKEFSTVGVDKNIIASSIEAIKKGFNYYILYGTYKHKLNF
jgi:2-isopropylmalate synthase